MNPYGTPVPGAIDFVPGHILDGDSAYSSLGERLREKGRIMVLPEADTYEVFDGLGGKISEGRAQAPWDFPVRSIPLWDKEIERVNELLYADGITEAKIDEIALLLPQEEFAFRFVMDATLIDGISHFNASYDRVKTGPIEHSYRVRYDFLQIEGKPYRVEAMHFPYGETSPLHAPVIATAQRYETPMPVHLSFKCASLTEYAVVTQRLGENPNYTLAMDCESTYGMFSYWKHNESDLYLKPRVNVRDAK